MSEVFGYVKFPLEELRDLLPGTDGFDFGTSPHGLFADLPLPVQETRERFPLIPPAKPVLPFGEPSINLATCGKTPVTGASHVNGTGEFSIGEKKPPVPVSGTSDAVPLLTSHAATPRAQQPVPLPAEADSPGVYRSPAVRSACRFLRAAVAKLAPKDVHYLRLTEAEFLHAYAAVENDRNHTRRAIRKGFADPQDLKASDSLWHALQNVQARRLRKAWRLP